jgi:hypothetical protein
MKKTTVRRSVWGRALLMLVLTSLAASIGVLSAASSALATPTGEFAVFSDCPVNVSKVIACIYAKTESGEFVVGKKTVPLEKPVILQGGLREVNPEALAEFTAATDGNTLTKAPQNVPGGLAGLINCTEIKGFGLLEVLERGTCKSIFENGLTGVTATTELAAPAGAIGVKLGNLLNQEGTALSLPVKVHLENPLLGSSCFVGSSSSPVILELTTGKTSPPAPNKPISGKLGTLEFGGEGEILKIHNNSLVDNAFAAPKSSGCGGIFEFLIGPIINSQLGVPSAAGHNTAILNGTLQQTAAAAVKAHE